jgi:glutamate synthase (NADPH/NADH) large chain
LLVEQQRFGYTAEDLKLILASHGSKRDRAHRLHGRRYPPGHPLQTPRLLYDYFRQLFAQVTNPPLDAIREKLVTALSTTMGSERNLFAETPLHCRQLQLISPS